MNSSPAQLYTDDDVYRNVWTNWSQGRVRGATLTLSRRNGGLLTAFLALFVTVVGTRFWRIGCFFIYRYFSSHHAISSQDAKFSHHAKDTPFHQRQAILRNATNSTSGLWTLLRACWAWRRNGLASYRRFLPSVFFAILTSIVFAIATIFSSEVTTSMGHEVLLKGSNCDFLPIFNESHDEEANREIGFYLSQRTTLSMTYAQRCYNDNANLRDCSCFISQNYIGQPIVMQHVHFPAEKIFVSVISTIYVWIAAILTAIAIWASTARPKRDFSTVALSIARP